jgi:hypothetical protein
MVAIGASDFASLVKNAVDARMVELATAKTHDEQIRDAIDAQRGKGRPLPPEQLIYCKSPITGSTFTARLIESRNKEIGNRVVELLDYQRPQGWNVHKMDGGMVPDVWPLVEGEDIDVPFDPKRKPGLKFSSWFWAEFLQKDAAALIGLPLPKNWRAPAAGEVEPSGSITLTPEQMTQLGITPEQIRAALGADKAAE